MLKQVDGQGDVESRECEIGIQRCCGILNTPLSIAPTVRTDAWSSQHISCIFLFHLSPIGRLGTDCRKGFYFSEARTPSSLQNIELFDQSPIIVDAPFKHSFPIIRRILRATRWAFRS